MIDTIRRAPRALARIGLLLLILLPLAGCTDVLAGSRDLDIIWPDNGATLYRYETLRARVRGEDLEDYEIYWSVDNGRERRMYDEWYDSPRHKSYDVDTWDWYWNGSGPYTISFVAEDWRGRRIAHRSVRVYLR